MAERRAKIDDTRLTRDKASAWVILYSGVAVAMERMSTATEGSFAHRASETDEEFEAFF